MNEQMIVSSFGALITLAIAYLFFYVLWQRYVIDVTRQQLFELRDQLFDLAADGKLSFQSETYKILRKVFNTSIRFAHEADWVHIYVFYITATLKAKGSIYKSAMQIPHLIKHIEDEKVRAEVQKIFIKMHLTLVWHVYRRSLVLLPFVPIVVIVAAFVTLSNRFFVRTPQKIEALISARAYSAL